jgi:hypothetical protein
VDESKPAADHPVMVENSVKASVKGLDLGMRGS